MFWAEIWQIPEFLSENFQFLVVKFSIYLNRRVFVVMWIPNQTPQNVTTDQIPFLTQPTVFRSFVIIEPFRKFRKFMKVTDEAYLDETS